MRRLLNICCDEARSGLNIINRYLRVRKTAIMKKLVFALLLLAGFSGATAQEIYNSSGKANYKKKKEKKGYDADRLVLGGGMNFGMGNGFLRVGVSPIVGYRLQKNFYAGVGMGYQYYKAPYDETHNEYMNMYYPNIWTRYYVYRNIFVNATYEYDFISVRYPLDRFGNFNETKSSVTNQCLLLGVGLRQSLGGRLSFYGELFYDVMQGQYSPYPKGFPGMRFGLATGF